MSCPTLPKDTQIWSSGLLPLLLLIVPVGGEALYGVDSHVQHPLGLLGLPLWGKGVRGWWVDWKSRGKLLGFIMLT